MTSASNITTFVDRSGEDFTHFRTTVRANGLTAQVTLFQDAFCNKVSIDLAGYTDHEGTPLPHENYTYDFDRFMDALDLYNQAISGLVEDFSYV